MQLPLLLPLDPLHASSLKDGLPLSGGERLQETSVPHVCVTDGGIGVSVWDLIHRQPFGFPLVNDPAGHPLEIRATDTVRPRLRRRAAANE